MKIVNIIGGLGNQMFQYALYQAIRHRYPDEDVKLFTGAFTGYNVHVGYELDKDFGIKADRATLRDMLRCAYPYINYRAWQIGYHMLPQRKSMLNERIFGHYYEEVFHREGDCYYDGYWQNERYFSSLRQELLLAFTPLNVDERNHHLAMKLSSCNSVSIHVRRGDFLKKGIYSGICDIDYYRAAISRMLRQTDVEIFCIFSNNIPWCKENVVPLLQGRNVLVVDWNAGERSYLDMYLMSSCRHNIIAHSSFSWWAAWLNQHSDKIVIGPRKWNNVKGSEFELSESWIKI